MNHPDDHTSVHTTGAGGVHRDPKGNHTMNDEPSGAPSGAPSVDTGDQHELATVHPLHVPTDDTDDTEIGVTAGEAVEPAGDVVEGEIITDEEYRRLTSQKEQALERWRGYGRDVATVGRVAHRVATHDHTKTAAKTAGRHAYYLAGGAWDTLSSVYHRWTGRDIDEQIAAAKAAGEHGVAAQLLTQRTENKKLFLERIKVWGQFFVRVPKILGGLAALTLGITLIASIRALCTDGVTGFEDTWDGLFNAVSSGFEWMVWAATVPLPALLVATVAGVLVKGYNTRRRRTAAPDWLMADKQAGGGNEVLVTADGIVRALQKLGIPALNREFKEGWQPQFELTPTREGHGLFKGYRARFSLPAGVPAGMVADKRAVLAHNLHRDEIEVWPTDYGKVKGGRRGFIDLYVADAGVMEQPTPEYPLMHSGLADVFAGVPAGINQRGEELVFPLVGANVGVGGQPGQGKSNLMRVVFLGAALDPLAELRVHVFAGNGDFDEYAPRLSHYDKGADPEHAERAVEHLRELLEEVERRENRLAELGAKKLSRPLAEKHPDLRPLIVGFSECHAMFQAEAPAGLEADDPEAKGGKPRKLGKEAAELAVDVVKRGRKTGIVTLYDTQSARAKAIPTELVEQLGINACFYVKSWRNNDGFLGDGSFAAGIRATDLRFNVDRGTCVATGISEELFELLRTYYIEVDDDRGWDAATEVIARAMKSVDPHTPIDGDRPVAEPEQRKLLPDLDEVLGTERVSAAEAAKALVASFGRGYYRDGKPMTGPQLVDELAEVGVKVPSTKNKYHVDPVTVRKALARQSTADRDE